MEKEKRTKLEIIDQVLKVILYHGRAYHDGKCMYRIEEVDHPGCAVGQFILPDVYKPQMEQRDADCLQDYIKREMDEEFSSLDDILIPEYRGHHIDFWMELQDLHDDNSYWDGRQLSESGEKRLAGIKEKYQ